MSNVNKYTAPALSYDKTVSFGTHRQSDLPASALRAGASSLPAAWQTRGIATGGSASQHGGPVRTFADIALDPVRWALATKSRTAMTLSAIGVAVVMQAL